MKNVIREYLPLDNKRKREIWTGATFIFDTNVLLDLYRYTKSTREALIKAIEARKDQVFMPYHIAYEFMRRRCDIIYETCDKTDADLKKKEMDFLGSIKTAFRLTPDDSHYKKLNDFISDWITEQCKDSILVENPNNDKILNKILDVFENKVGDEENVEQLQALQLEGEERYAMSVPPGYEDNKKDDNKYGDFIIWDEIIKFASENKQDVILVTSDKKEDWWQIVRGRTIGPRVELRREFYDKTKQEFVMYTMENFLTLNNEEGGNDIPDTAIEEVVKLDDFNKLFKTNYHFIMENYKKYPESGQVTLDDYTLDPHIYEDFVLKDKSFQECRLLRNKIAREKQYVEKLKVKYGSEMPIKIRKLVFDTQNQIEINTEKLSQLKGEIHEIQH